MIVRKAIASLLAVLVLMSALSACSLPTETKPRALDRKQFPLILDPDAKSATTVPASQGKIGFVCFVRQASKDGPKNIGCVQRQLKVVSPDSLFEAVAAGPDPDESRIGGYSSAVPQKATLLGVSPVSTTGVLTINLSEEMNTVSAPNNTVAYHQIVQTLTMSDNGLDAQAISVKIAGEPIKIPTDNGPKTVATIDDYDSTVAARQNP